MKDKKIVGSLKKIAQKIISFDSKYPFSLMLIYFYTVFFVLLFSILYLFTFLIISPIVKLN